MRIALAVIAASLIAGLSVPASAQNTTPVALTGKMQPFSYLLGTPWSCTTNVPAMGSMPAHTDQGTAMFEVAPGNVVHGHASTSNYSADFYYGYSERSNMYWETSADSMAGHGFLTSTDGRTYSGNMSMGPIAGQSTVTYGRSGNTKVTVHEVTSGGVIDSVCTR